MTYFECIKSVGRLSLPWEKLDSCNILITGASGLIGSSVVEVLMERQQRGYHVFAMGRNLLRMQTVFSKYMPLDDFHLLAQDVTEPLNQKLSFQYIIHAASGAVPSEFAQHPVEVMKANLNGVINLMEYGLSHGMKRFLYVSSGEIYGEGDGRPFEEEYSGYVDCTSPRSCYPSSKRAAETLCVSYASEYNADVVIARPCHVFGPHFSKNDNRVYAEFIRNAIRGENIVMKSAGDQLRSWCYVVDCASALFYILLNGRKSEAYNISDDNSAITIREFAELIAEIGGCLVTTQVASDSEKKGYNPVKISIYSTKKLHKLGWKTIGSIRDNMSQTIAESRKFLL